MLKVNIKALIYLHLRWTIDQYVYRFSKYLIISGLPESS